MRHYICRVATYSWPLNSILTLFLPSSQNFVALGWRKRHIEFSNWVRKGGSWNINQLKNVILIIHTDFFDFSIKDHFAYFTCKLWILRLQLSSNQESHWIFEMRNPKHLYFGYFECSLLKIRSGWNVLVSLSRDRTFFHSKKKLDIIKLISCFVAPRSDFVVKNKCWRRMSLDALYITECSSREF